MRLDQYITQKLQTSKNKAQSLIKTGNIKVNLKTVLKPWFSIKNDDKIDISKTEELNYVARSALKLKWFL